MKLRDLICELMDCGIDDLDAEVIAFHEESVEIDINKEHICKDVAIQDDFIDVSKNGDAVQIFVHTRPFTDV